MSMFNECHIHLCDCTWLNVFSHARSLLIKFKKIFKCFSCLWKVFCFCKNVKNFKKKLCCLVLVTQSQVGPLASPHRDFSQLISGSMPQSWKILKYFSKFGFLMFLATQSGDFFAGGRSSCEGSQRFSRLTSRVPLR